MSQSDGAVPFFGDVPLGLGGPDGTVGPGKMLDGDEPLIAPVGTDNAIGRAVASSFALLGGGAIAGGVGEWPVNVI